MRKIRIAMLGGSLFLMLGCAQQPDPKTASAGPWYSHSQPSRPVDSPAVVPLDQLIVYFSPSSARMDRQTQSAVDDWIAELAMVNSSVQIRVDAHTDSDQSHESNQRLAWRRAMAVSGYLQRRGVKPRAIRIRAYGERSPWSSNHSRSGRRLNRRVAISASPTDRHSVSRY